MPLIIGQHLQNRYRIVKQLGQGGMGAVYLAEDVQSAGQRVAIKEQIPDPQADPRTLNQLRQQFQVEAQILQNLNHSNLPNVFAYFSEAGNEYIVMEYIEGDNLEDLLQKQGGPLPEKPVLFWADQLLDALGYLHSQPHPIIHRDIKPANIIVTRLGEIKLVDFGLVKLLDASNPLTGTVIKGMGTPEYTPLEQYGRGSLHTDGRSDIYALGTTLYHLLTGVAPLDAPQRLMDPAQLHSLRTYSPALSNRAEGAILKAMAMQPHHRYPSAQAFRAALIGTQPVMAPSTVAISQAIGGYPPPPPARRDRRGAILLIGMVVVALLLLAIFPTVRNIVPGLTPTATTIVAVTDLTTPTTAPATELANTITPTTATSSEPGSLATPTSATSSDSGSLATPTTDAPAPLVCTSDAVFMADVTIPAGAIIEPGHTFVKAWRVGNTGTCEWDSSYALVFVNGNQFGAPSAPITAASPGQEATISLSMVAPTEPGTYHGTWQLQDAAGQPFGELLSVVINVQDAPTITPTERPEPTKSPTPTCTSTASATDVTIPDGTELSANSSFVKTWRVRNTGTCAWDSSYALVFVEGNLVGPQLASLPALKTNEEGNVSLDMVAPTTSGTYNGIWDLLDKNGVAFAHLTVAIKVPGDPTPVPPAIQPPAPVGSTQITFISNRDGNKEIYVMNADGTSLERLTYNDKEENKPVWSPNGTQIAFESYRDGNAEIYVMNTDGSRQTRLTNDLANDEWPSWLPNGQVLFQSNSSRKWDIHFMNTDGSGYTNLTDTSIHEIQPAWSPNNRQIVYVSRVSSEDHWDIYTINSDGGGSTRLTSNSFDDIQPAWDPTGTRIAFAGSTAQGANYDIYVMNADGSGLRNLTNHSANDTRPTWSSDGQYITFTSNRDDNKEIYLMNADGSGLRNLTNHPANDQWAAWSP